MAYTVKRLSKLSGISVRTLHWYDEIGLLKPAYQGENGYRYYEEEQLLRLQQILFFKELGFRLGDIQKLMAQEDFDRVDTLRAHRKVLVEHIGRQNALIQTIDKTIQHLSGEITMKIEEIFTGFTAEKQRLYYDYLLEHGVSADTLKQSQKRTQDWSKDEWVAHKNAGDKVHTDLVALLKKNEKPDADSVQTILKRHYDLTCQFWTPDRSGYKALGELYGSHPDFVSFYEKLHPGLLPFLQAAMNVFADQNL